MDQDPAPPIEKPKKGPKKKKVQEDVKTIPVHYDQSRDAFKFLPKDVFMKKIGGWRLTKTSDASAPPKKHGKRRVRKKKRTDGEEKAFRDTDFNATINNIVKKKAFERGELLVDRWIYNKDLCGRTHIAQLGLGSLDVQQNFGRLYFDPDNPNAGIMLYHLVGLGKTCTFFSIAGQFRNRGKKIVYITSDPEAADNVARQMWCYRLGWEDDKRLLGGKTYAFSEDDTDAAKKEKAKWNDPVRLTMNKFANLLTGTGAIEMCKQFGIDKLDRANGNVKEKGRCRAIFYDDDRDKDLAWIANDDGDDPLENMVLIFDEQDLFFKNMTRPKRKNVEVVEYAIFRSFRRSKENSVRVIFSSWTPVPTNPVDCLRYCNWMIREEEHRIPIRIEATRSPTSVYANVIDPKTGKPKKDANGKNERRSYKPVILTTHLGTELSEAIKYAHEPIPPGARKSEITRINARNDAAKQNAKIWAVELMRRKLRGLVSYANGKNNSDLFAVEVTENIKIEIEVESQQSTEINEVFDSLFLFEKNARYNAEKKAWRERRKQRRARGEDADDEDDPEPERPDGADVDPFFHDSDDSEGDDDNVPDALSKPPETRTPKEQKAVERYEAKKERKERIKRAKIDKKTYSAEEVAARASKIFATIREQFREGKMPYQSLNLAVLRLRRSMMMSTTPTQQNVATGKPAPIKKKQIRFQTDDFDYETIWEILRGNIRDDTGREIAPRMLKFLRALREHDQKTIGEFGKPLKASVYCETSGTYGNNLVCAFLHAAGYDCVLARRRLSQKLGEARNKMRDEIDEAKKRGDKKSEAVKEAKYETLIEWKPVERRVPVPPDILAQWGPVRNDASLGPRGNAFVCLDAGVIDLVAEMKAVRPEKGWSVSGDFRYESESFARTDFEWAPGAFAKLRELAGDKIDARATPEIMDVLETMFKFYANKRVFVRSKDGKDPNLSMLWIRNRVNLDAQTKAKKKPRGARATKKGKKGSKKAVAAEEPPKKVSYTELLDQYVAWLATLTKTSEKKEAFYKLASKQLKKFKRAQKGKAKGGDDEDEDDDDDGDGEEEGGNAAETERGGKDYYLRIPVRAFFTGSDTDISLATLEERGIIRIKIEMDSERARAISFLGLRDFNNRGTNLKTHQFARIALLGRKQRQGIDVLDVNSMFVLDEMSPEFTEQVHGRDLRRCGQSGLGRPQNEPVKVYFYHFPFFVDPDPTEIRTATRPASWVNEIEDILSRRDTPPEFGSWVSTALKLAAVDPQKGVWSDLKTNENLRTGYLLCEKRGEDEYVGDDDLWIYERSPHETVAQREERQEEQEIYDELVKEGKTPKKKPVKLDHPPNSLLLTLISKDHTAYRSIHRSRVTFVPCTTERPLPNNDATETELDENGKQKKRSSKGRSIEQKRSLFDIWDEGEARWIGANVRIPDTEQGKIEEAICKRAERILVKFLTTNERRKQYGLVLPDDRNKPYTDLDAMSDAAMIELLRIDTYNPNESIVATLKVEEDFRGEDIGVPKELGDYRTQRGVIALRRAGILDGTRALRLLCLAGKENPALAVAAAFSTYPKRLYDEIFKKDAKGRDKIDAMYEDAIQMGYSSVEAKVLSVRFSVESLTRLKLAMQGIFGFGVNMTDEQAKRVHSAVALFPFAYSFRLRDPDHVDAILSHYYKEILDYYESVDKGEPPRNRIKTLEKNVFGPLKDPRWLEKLYVESRGDFVAICGEAIAGKLFPDKAPAIDFLKKYTAKIWTRSKPDLRGYFLAKLAETDSNIAISLVDTLEFAGRISSPHDQDALKELAPFLMLPSRAEKVEWVSEKWNGEDAPKPKKTPSSSSEKPKQPKVKRPKVVRPDDLEHLGLSVVANPESAHPEYNAFDGMKLGRKKLNDAIRIWGFREGDDVATLIGGDVGATNHAYDLLKLWDLGHLVVDDLDVLNEVFKGRTVYADIITWCAVKFSGEKDPSGPVRREMVAIKEIIQGRSSRDLAFGIEFQLAVKRTIDHVNANIPLKGDKKERSYTKIREWHPYFRVLERISRVKRIETAISVAKHWGYAFPASATIYDVTRYLGALGSVASIENVSGRETYDAIAKYVEIKTTSDKKAVVSEGQERPTIETRVPWKADHFYGEGFKEFKDMTSKKNRKSGMEPDEAARIWFEVAYNRSVGVPMSVAEAQSILGGFPPAQKRAVEKAAVSVVSREDDTVHVDPASVAMDHAGALLLEDVHLPVTEPRDADDDGGDDVEVPDIDLNPPPLELLPYTRWILHDPPYRI
jgi:hypothetical protein